MKEHELRKRIKREKIQEQMPESTRKRMDDLLDGLPEETAQSALEQIRQRKYREELKTKGIKEEQIKEYGFAFEGKTVLIVD